MALWDSILNDCVHTLTHSLRKPLRPLWEGFPGDFYGQRGSLGTVKQTAQAREPADACWESGGNHLTSSVAFDPFPRSMLLGEPGLGRKPDALVIPVLGR